MKRSIILRSKAEEDVFRAQTWYDAQVAGLGDDFVGEMDRAMESLETMGQRFPLSYGRFRRLLLPRFPYKIFYLVEKDRIVVARILHAKRKHQRFLKR